MPGPVTEVEAAPPPAPGPGPVLVLGGAGFIGRHAVEALLAGSQEVLVGSRHPARAGRRLPGAARDCERRQVRFEALQGSADWTPLLEGVGVVLNCVGILREHGRETYDRVHHRAPAALAARCAAVGVPLLHVSALGLDVHARSGFLRSKRQGELAIGASGARGGIVRPSLLDAAHDGYGAAWLRRVARWPLLALPADATGRIAALAVEDLGEALARLAVRPHPAFGEYDFGGDEALTLRDYVAKLRQATGRPPATVIPVPGWLARLGAHACDAFHVTPFSFGHWELLRRDNRPRRNRITEVLGRPPRAIGGVGPAPASAFPAPAAVPRPGVEAAG